MPLIHPNMKTRLTEEQLAYLVEKNPPRVLADGQFTTGAVRLSMVHLDKPHGMPNDPEDKKRYQVHGLFPHKNIAIIKDLIRARTLEYYPNQDPDGMMQPMNKAHPLKDQALMAAKYAGYVPGLPYIAAKSPSKLALHKLVAGQPVDVMEHEVKATFYGGCWAILKLNTYKPKVGSPCAIIGLQGALKILDDTSFGGGAAGASASDYGTVDTGPIVDPNLVPDETAPAGDGW